MSADMISKAIGRGVGRAVNDAVPGMVDTVMDALFKHPAYAVIAGGQLRLMRAGLEPRKAWRVSKQCLSEFLKDENVEVGDPRYDWSDEAGRTLAEQYEIEHWDAPTKAQTS